MDNLIIYNARIVTPAGRKALCGTDMSHLNIIERGMVRITRGVIDYVGDNNAEMIEAKGDEYHRLDAEGRCLLPGFVDSHTHLIFGGERAEEFSWRLKGDSYMSIMQRGGGIVNTVKATRKMSVDDMVHLASVFIRRMSKMGVTTVEAKSGYGLDLETEIRMLTAMKKLNDNEDLSAPHLVDLVPTFLGAHAVPKEYQGRSDDYVDFIIREVLPIVKDKQLADCCDVFCEDGVFSVEQSRRLLSAAKEMGFNLKIHADEIVSFGGAELAAELGALSADHLLHASDKGIHDMAEAGVVATLLPLTAFALREQYARGREMIDSGCAVALATDLNPGSCFSGSIPLTIALACIYMHLSVEETITALTLNGAAAVGRADSIGSIEVGKKGDLCLLYSPDYNVLPYYVGMSCVSATIKEGEIFYNELCH
jgi:imidazolonepropionase